MSKPFWKNFWSSQSDAFRLSLATGAGCLGVAGAWACCLRPASITQSALGLAVVGCFYLVLAAREARWRSPALPSRVLPAAQVRPIRVECRNAMRTVRWDRN